MRELKTRKNKMVSNNFKQFIMKVEEKSAQVKKLAANLEVNTNLGTNAFG